MPVLHPVTQMREWQRAPFQAGLRHLAGVPAGRRRRHPRRAAVRRAAGGHIRKIGQDQEEYAGSAQKGGDPRRGGERGSPNGPAPGGQSRARTRKAYVYPGQVTNRSRHADNENMLSVISSLAVSSSAEAARRPAAAFFDLDKTIIAKSSTLAYGPSFYRNGLISRGDAVRSAFAQLLFSRRGASHERMEQIRAQVSQLCQGWPA